MIENEFEAYQRNLDDITREHTENMDEIMAHLEEQADSTSYDIMSYFEENFTMTEANMALSAKVQTHSKDASSGDIMMYAALALCTLFTVAWKLRNVGKRPEQAVQVDVFERLI